MPTQLTLRPSDYEDLVIAESVRLADGTVIKAGTKLADLFPDGMIVRPNIDGGLDVHNQSVVDWIGPSSIQPAIEVQQQNARLEAILMNHWQDRAGDEEC